jgi:kynurenine formamidase
MRTFERNRYATWEGMRYSSTMSSAPEPPPSEDYGPSNWGRWGPDDERGTLNLIRPDHILAAARLVRRGVVVTLGAPLGPDGPIAPTRDRTWHTVKHRHGPLTGVAEDVLTVNSHAGTHIDALSHALMGRRMYNGFDVDEHVVSAGITRNAITAVGAIVARGVLLDLAAHRGVDHLELGEVITPADLDECARHHGVEVGQGDVCLVRTGWYRIFQTDRARFDDGEPGLSYRCAEWFHRLRLVAVGADTCAVDVLPGEPGVRPYGLHPRIINQQGGYLIEYLDLEALSAERTYEFLFVASPLKITGAAGSPINPVAIL